VFGGFGSDMFNTSLNDLWQFDLVKLTWLLMDVIGTPSARFGHTLHVLFTTTDSFLVVYGGSNSTAAPALPGVGVFNVTDDYTNTTTTVWKQLQEVPDSKQLGGGLPPPRIHHTTNVVDVGITSESAIVIYGGFSGSELAPDPFLADMWRGMLMDDMTFVWQQTRTSDSQNVFGDTRFGHSSEFLVYNGTHYLVSFGGISNPGSGLPSAVIDVVRYGCNPVRKRRGMIKGIRKEAERPRRRMLGGGRWSLGRQTAEPKLRK
jgi:hypothetical protein